MQAKTTLIFYLTPVRMTMIKKIWLSKHNMNKEDTNRHADGERRKLMRPHTRQELLANKKCSVWEK